MVGTNVNDFAHIWNSLELYSLYSELGGTLLSQHSLIRLEQNHFQSNLVVLSSSGIASISVFLGNASNHMCITDDVEDDSDAETISTVAKRIKTKCLN